MSATDPRLTVVIACYDQAGELELTLGSFLRQRLPVSLYELIVVDDHSPTHAARDVVLKFRLQYPEASLLYVRQHRADGGQYGSSARAKNIGLRLARGEYVFFNNAEIVQAGESLTYILNVMGAAERPLCLRGRVIDLPREELAGRTQAELERLHDRTDRRRERVASADHAGLAAVSRPLLLSVGGNDERFDYWGKEDLDLAARLKRAGATYVYDENLKSFHISHPANHVKQGDYLRMISLLDENNTRELVEANRGRLWGSLNPAPREELEGTVVVEAGADMADLSRRLESVLYRPGAEHYEALVFCAEADRAAVEVLLDARFRTVNLVSLAPEDMSPDAPRVRRHLRTSRRHVLAAGATFDGPRWEESPEDPSPFAGFDQDATAARPSAAGQTVTA
jgi:GT2 family glycosyltransferase